MHIHMSKIFIPLRLIPKLGIYGSHIKTRETKLADTPLPRSRQVTRQNTHDKSFENSTEDANSSENVGRHLQSKPKNLHNQLKESISISTRLRKSSMS